VLERKAPSYPRRIRYCSGLLYLTAMRRHRCARPATGDLVAHIPEARGLYLEPLVTAEALFYLDRGGAIHRAQSLRPGASS
jgi:hypothetical protein